VYIAGRFPAEAKQAITAAFEKWDKGPAPTVNVPNKTVAKSVHLVDRPGAAQSTVRVGLSAPDPTAKDYIPLQVTNSLLGGSFASRITRNIREQKGYTYSPFSMISTRYHDAYWVEAADVTTSVTGPAIAEIYKEIRELRQKPPGEPELEGITSLLAGLFVIQNSSPRGIIGQLDFIEFQELDDNWLRTYVQRVEAVKPQDVQRIAETYLDPNKMALVVVGDKAKIESQVELFRKGQE
jgi:predicted Zn-dependent peptidase